MEVLKGWTYHGCKAETLRIVAKVLCELACGLAVVFVGFPPGSNNFLSLF